jgi:cyclohexyl-isocyanide hydratase
MDRRDFVLGMGILPMLPAFVDTASAAQPSPVSPASSRLKIGMLVCPNMILLDLVGLQAVFSILQADVRLVWNDKQPVSTDVGIPIIANDTFESCPADLDVLFVPGGLMGSVACMNE